MGWEPDGRFGEQDLGWTGVLAHPSTLDVLVRAAAARLGREPLMLGEGAECPARGVVHRWRSVLLRAGHRGRRGLLHIGGGLRADDPPGPGVGVAYLAIGHHASERYGVQALGAHLAQAFGVEAEFVEVENPV
jgi:putative NIF3 family GTP cyclohydrolase 1 type 2